MSDFKNTRKVDRDDLIIHRIADLMDSANLAQSHIVRGEGDKAKGILSEATSSFVNRLSMICRKVQVTHKCELGHLYVRVEVQDEHGEYEATLKAVSPSQE
jgi:hypothetical protein